jgi:hypothetical protein
MEGEKKKASETSLAAPAQQTQSSESVEEGADASQNSQQEADQSTPKRFMFEEEAAAEESPKPSEPIGRCCKPVVKPSDPKYLSRPVADPECRLDPHRPVERYDEAVRKRAYIARVLKKEM